MRFAGSRMEGFLNPNKPDFGEVANQGMANRSALNNAATITESQVNQAGVAAAAKVEAANLIGAAQSAQADASTFASGMGMIGSIAGGVMGGMGNAADTGSLTTGSAYNSISDPTDSFKALGLTGKIENWAEI